MKVFGYQKESELLSELREVSFKCTIEELEKLIDFLEQAKVEHSRVEGKTDLCHSHLRDWDETWEKGNPDVIVVSTFK